MQLVSQTGNVTYYGEGEYWGFSTCRHWRTPVEIHGVPGKLYASGHQSSPKGSALDWLPYPDMGVYLSTFWFEDLGGIAAVGMEVALTPLWPFITVAWPDYGAVSQTYYKMLVGTVVTALSEGKTVEIACAGGHGRTGTLIAGVLATVEHLDAKDTLTTLRARYCVSAVESHKQEVMLYTLLGETPPAAPYSAPVRECVCGHSDGMHGLAVGGADYKTGKCIRQGCTCARFVDSKAVGTKGSLKPCTCGHAKNKHRGHLKLCVKCGVCGGYEAEAPLLAPEPYKQLPLSTAYTNGNTYSHPYKYPKVCLCGHLLSTHTFGINNECKLCVCHAFDDADNHEDADDKAYMLPSRNPLKNKDGTLKFPPVADTSDHRGVQHVPRVVHGSSPLAKTTESFDEWKRKNVVEGEVVQLNGDADVERLVRVLLDTTETQGDYDD